MTFFFDNNFSPKLASWLRDLDVDVIGLRDRFPQDIKDEDLLPQLYGSGWVLVTADIQIQKRPLQLQALKECGVSAIFFKRFWTPMSKWDQAHWMTKHWRAIEEHVQRFDPPVYFEVESNGRIRRIDL